MSRKKSRIFFAHVGMQNYPGLSAYTDREHLLNTRIGIIRYNEMSSNNKDGQIDKFSLRYRVYVIHMDDKKNGRAQLHDAVPTLQEALNQILYERGEDDGPSDLGITDPLWAGYEDQFSYFVIDTKTNDCYDYKPDIKNLVLRLK